MKSITNLGLQPALPVVADDLLEFHAARLLLLFRICGTRDRIDGLTKMAKLDFFVRYPQFFNRVCEHLGETATSETDAVESSMVRFHYGPWDRRYYHVLAYLEAKNLITVTKEKANAFTFALTDMGKVTADALRNKDAFSSIKEQMARVKRVLGAKSGSSLKNLVYEVFSAEVARKSLGDVIE
jgi:DNA-binding PadR family transcriptional regulator